MTLIEKALTKIFPLEIVRNSSYLHRWHLFGYAGPKTDCSASLLKRTLPTICGLSAYLHRFTGPDDDHETHDHPWNWASLVLRGWYIERVRDPGGFYSINIRKKWSLAFRGATFAHSIVRVSALVPCWTLVIRGPKIRDWGFFETQDGAPDKWVEWRMHNVG